MGLALAEIALSNGDSVLAGVRKPESLSHLSSKHPKTLVVTKLDVSIPSDITAAFARAKESFGRIDVVFNAAGYSMVGEVEGTPEKDARAMFDVNFWGATNVARAAISFFRDVNKPQGGRLITISSSAAIGPFPAAAFYSASKAAVEAVLYAMAKELDPDWNIKSTVVATGAFLTRAAQKDSQIIHDPHPAYSGDKCMTKAIRGYLGSGQIQGSDPVKGMKVIYEFLSKLPEPPLRFPLGPDSVGAFKATGEELVTFGGKYEAESSLSV